VDRQVDPAVEQRILDLSNEQPLAADVTEASFGPAVALRADRNQNSVDATNPQLVGHPPGLSEREGTAARAQPERHE
jgi:hypothetical protein